MAPVGFTDSRGNLASHLDQVENDRAELDSLRETLHLLGTPVNALRLSDGIAQLDAGRGIAHDLIDP